MDLRNNNNCYYNDYPIQGNGQQSNPYYNGAPGGYNGGPVPQQPPRQGNGRNGGNFLLGMVLGAAALPEGWTAPLSDTVLSGVDGFGLVRISDMARRTAALV